jgi:hypothetical protein
METIEIIPVPGFYKCDEESRLFCAPNYIIFPDGIELSIDQKDTYTYPVNDWYYFNSEEEARIFFNLPLPEETNGIQS